MPTGLRGVGKTVLLREFARIAESAGCSVIALEAPENGTFVASFGHKLRATLLRLDAGPASKLVTRALGVLKSFSLTEPHGFKLALDIDPARGVGDSGILDLDLSDVLIALGEAARDRKTGVLLDIDEVQYLGTDEFAALIVAIHQTTQRDLPIILVGAGLPQLPALSGEAKSYSERLFTFPVIGALDRNAAAEAITSPSRDLGVSFEKDGVARIIARSGGYAYFLQEYAYASWNVAAGPDKITACDVIAAEPIVERKLDENFFSVRIEQLTQAERRYLQTMAAQGTGPYRTAGIAKALNATQNGLSTVRQDLIDDGMAYASGYGSIAFAVPMFDEFLRRHPIVKPTRNRPSRSGRV